MAPNSLKHLICLTGSLTHLSYQFRFKKTTTVEKSRNSILRNCASNLFCFQKHNFMAVT